FAFEDRAYRFKVLPFGLALAPQTFTKQSGIRILNYLDQLRDALKKHKCQLLEHLKHLGLMINVLKSKLRPMQNITFLGMDLDLANAVFDQLSHLVQYGESGVSEMLSETDSSSCGVSARASTYETTSAMAEIPRAKQRVEERGCMQSLGPGSTRGCLSRESRWAEWSAGKSSRIDRLGSPLRRQTGLWHVKVCASEVAYKSLALQGFLPLIKDQHLLVRTDNTMVISYINHQGSIHSHSLQRLAERFLLWADRNLLSIRAVHVPGSQNSGVDMLSRGNPVHREWRLHPQTIQMIWSLFGEAEIDLFASEENAHCQLFFSLTNAPLEGDALLSRWPKKRRYAFPPVKIMPLVLQKIKEERVTVLLPRVLELVEILTAPPQKARYGTCMYGRSAQRAVAKTSPASPCPGSGAVSLTQHWLLDGDPTASQVAERMVIDRLLRALPRSHRQAVGMRNPSTKAELVEAIELADATQHRDLGERAPPFPWRVVQERRTPEGIPRPISRQAPPGPRDEPMPTEVPPALPRMDLPVRAPEADVKINGRPIGLG
ncbi:hypothetical protein M9458_002954, partial [Cirrhinus mrigala]